ncbi:MAG: hypothetical protein H7831_11025, partial [Magnetococcus sp. WYHC-3]
MQRPVYRGPDGPLPSGLRRLTPQGGVNQRQLRSRLMDRPHAPAPVMTLRQLTHFLATATLLALWPAPSEATWYHHQVTLSLDPASGTLQGSDLIRPMDADATGNARRPQLLLARSLEFDPASALISRRIAPGAHLRLWLDRSAPATPLTFQGVLRHPPREGSALDGSQPRTLGTLQPEGAHLTGASGWLPTPEDQDRLTWDMDLTLPATWLAHLPGVRRDRQIQGSMVRERWTLQRPVDEAILVAGPWLETVDAPAGKIPIRLLLRGPDAALAQRLIQASRHAVDLYTSLLGPYPHDQFAVVENFWESGLGLPGFTLLGPRVLRLPFILESSLPHEVLHNWWGNGVWVDYASGNWSEGLTSYLADHLYQELAGTGAAHRRQMLLRQLQWLEQGGDRPPRLFMGREDRRSQAVGYDKVAMVFHALRRELGDSPFREALCTLAQQYLGRVTAWEDVASVFSRVAGRSLDGFFHQWIDRAGLPSLSLVSVIRTPGEQGWALDITLEQDDDPPRRLTLPVAVTLEGMALAQWHQVTQDQARQTHRLVLPAAPLRVDVDPAFEVPRRLLPEERPPSLARALARRQGVAILPAAATEAQQAAWTAWARGLGLTPLDDAAPLPQGDSALWILGWNNAHRSRFCALLPPGTPCPEPGKGLPGREPPTTQSGYLLSAEDKAGGRPWVWLAAPPEQLPALARKLPHYGRQGALLFSGTDAHLVWKHEWPTGDSPLARELDPAGSWVPVSTPPQLFRGGGQPYPRASPCLVFGAEQVARL